MRLHIRPYYCAVVGFRDLSTTNLPLLDIRIRRLRGCRSGMWAMLGMAVVLISAVAVYYYCYIGSVRAIWCDLLDLLRMVEEARELFRLRGIRLGMARNSC